MKPNLPSKLSARLPGVAAGLALSFVFSGCAHHVTSRVAPESPVIAAAELPADWTAPRAVQKVAPVFPEHLKRAGLEGEVQLMCHIDAQGEVRHIAVAGASTAQFVEAASQAVQQWKFTPGTRAGQPIAMSVVVPIRFVFDESPAERPTLRALAAVP